MFYSDNHVEVGLDAFLASEEYAKESIKDIGLVFDQNTAGSTPKRNAIAFLFLYPYDLTIILKIRRQEML